MADKFTKSTPTYAEALVQLYKDVKMEFYTGDNSHTMKLSDQEIDIKALIVGTVESAIGECLIINVKGSSVALNSKSIIMAIPFNDPLFIKDAFDSEYDNFGSSIKHVKS